MCKHTEACEKTKAASAAWMAAHPDACTKCQGTGNTGKPEDPSVGLYGPDACPECVYKGKCPVCGASQPEDWEGDHCTCGWDWEDASTHGIRWECWCWENDTDAAEIEAAVMRFQMEREQEPVVLDDAFFRRAEDEFQMARERGLNHGFSRY